MRISCPGNPIGGVVTLGDAQIQNSIPGLTTIVQSTDRAVIDWQSFSIATGEHTNFIVPNATSATLNRVLGCDPSILNGTLTSNGHLFLINSNGIVFGQGSTVDVGSLTASALDLDNSTFMAGGEMVFRGSSEAAVKNSGMINASSGDVFLIGYQVSNSGTIRAPNGTVGLAAGSEVLIMPVGDERIVVRNAVGSRKKTGVSNSGLIEANVAELKAYGGNVYALAIRNTGRIAATGVSRQGGRILLSANGGRIENNGSLVARGTSGNGGQIKISAGSKGKATINGRVDADGPDGAGGKISITGEQVTIRRAILVSADGTSEGGQINIGSDAETGSDEALSSKTIIEGLVSSNSSQGIGGEIRLGGNSLSIQSDSVISANGALGGGRVFAGGGFPSADGSLINSSCVLVDCGALLTANAVENGNGGNVMVLASRELTFQGSLQSLGGRDSGDGGLAVLSAKEALSVGQLTGRVDLSAFHGRAGSLLIESGEMVILNPGNCPPQNNYLDAADISSFLNTANLTVQTDRIGGGSGNVIMSGTVAWCSANSLTINSDCDFSMINSEAGVGIIDSQGGGNVTINAARSDLLESSTMIGTTAGNVLVSARQAGINIGGSITTDGGNVSLTGVGVTSTGGAVDAGSGTVLVDGNDGAISLAGAVKTTNGTSSAVRIIDATTVSLGDIKTGAAGTVVLGEAGGDSLSGAVTQTGGIDAGTVVGNAGSTVTLDGNNTVVNLGELTSVGDFVFKDTAGGLNVTGSVETRGGVASISTAGGELALGGNNITTAGGNVSLTGQGVTSTGGKVDAGDGTISVDGNDGAINLAGGLKTTNGTDKAVRIVDASSVSLGNITAGAAGTVALGEAGGENLSGAVTQTGTIDAGTVVGNAGSTVTLDGNNSVVNLGSLTSTAAFVFRDTTGGLNVTGGVETRGGTVSISTAGGALALGGNNITTSGGNVSLTGQGVTSTGGTVNAGSGTITVDGNDGAINLAGALTTTNETSKAVRIIDATSASLGNVKTGAAGTVVLGEAAGDNLSGAVTQTGAIKAGGVSLAGSGDFALTGAANAIGVLATEGAVGSLALENGAGLKIATIGTGSGLSAVGGIRVSTAGPDGLLIQQNVTSQGGSISLNASRIDVNGATVTSTGAAAVTLTANQFVLSSQPIIKGSLNGVGGTAQISLNDSNLTTGQNYTIGADKITAGSRTYAFQAISSVRMDLGTGNDFSDTNFFVFSQFLNAGGGSNKLLVGGNPVTTSPMTRPGFGTITFSSFALAPPPPAAAPTPSTSPLGAVVLQNATPGSGPGSSSSSQTNNFNSTGTSGVSSGAGAALAGLGAGGASASLAGGLAASLSGAIGQSLGLVSAGGGGPPSFGLQSQMGATTSAAAESELSLALGGNGTMGVRSSTGLVSVDPTSGPPSPQTMARLDEGFSLLALSELSLGALGSAQVTVTSQLGVQSMALGGLAPATALQQMMTQSANPESFSSLYSMLGGDGTARIDHWVGSLAVDLKGKGVPGYVDSILASLFTPGAFAELSLVLGGTGEFKVNDSQGLAIMDPSSTPAGKQLSAMVSAMLAATTNSQLSQVLAGEGGVLVMAWDGIQSTALDTALPSTRVIADLNASTNSQSLEELDTATR